MSPYPLHGSASESCMLLLTLYIFTLDLADQLNSPRSKFGECWPRSILDDTTNTTVVHFCSSSSMWLSVWYRCTLARHSWPLSSSLEKTTMATCCTGVIFVPVSGVSLSYKVVGVDCWLCSSMSPCLSPRLHRDPRRSRLFYRHISPWSLVVLFSWYVCHQYSFYHVHFVASYHKPRPFQSFLCYSFGCLCFSGCSSDISNTFVSDLILLF